MLENTACILVMILIGLLTVETINRMREKEKMRVKMEKAEKELNEILQILLEKIIEEELKKEKVEKL